MTAQCLHCAGKCRLTSGREVYPHRSDLWGKPIYKCDSCAATVGCHPGTKKPLGKAADKATRRARMLLHERRIDPLWKKRGKRARGVPRQERREVYAFLAREMGLAEFHAGEASIEQCRKAWDLLSEFWPTPEAET